MKVRLDVDQRIEIYVIIELILATLINFFTVILNNKLLTSICFNLSFIVFFILVIDFIIKVKKLSSWSIGLIFLSTLSVILSYSFNNYIPFTGLENTKCLIFFIVTNIFYYILSKIRITKELYKIVLNIAFLVILTDIASYYLLKNRVTMAHAITLNFSNPNQTGLWLSVAFMFGILKCAEENSKFKKIIFFLLDIMLLPLIIKTLSRNSLISILFVGILIVYGKIFRKKKLPKFFIYLIILFPLIFCFLYLLLINTPFAENFSFLIGEGKSLTSRLSIWNFALEQFLKHPIIGNYSEIMFYGNGVAQFHNTGIDICVKYGIIVYFIFCKFTYNIINKINRRYLKKVQYLAMYCFLGVILQGIFEAGIYSGYSGLDYLIGGFIIIGRGVTQNIKLEKNKIWTL